MKVLIQSAKIIAPQSAYHHQVKDIFIEDGKLSKIEDKITDQADQTVKADNLHVSLGWFDSGVSFGEPGYEERETLDNGLKVAAQSGFTGIVLNPDVFPVTDHHGAVSYLKSKSVASAVNLYPMGALTVNLEGRDLAEIYDMSLAGAVVFGDYKQPIQNANLLKIAFQYAQGFDGLIQSFPLEESLVGKGGINEGEVSIKMGLKAMPAFAEELQINRDLEILKYAGGKLHIPTISTKKGLERIEKAKSEGLDVSCSVALHNLFYTDEKVLGFDTHYKVLPPLRTDEDRKALIAAVKTGLIDMVTADHCPINIEHKKVEFELAKFGSLGLESAFGVLQQIFGLDKSIEILTAGRERFGIENPEFKIGAKAELTFFDPDTNYTREVENIQSLSKNSMYLGEKLTGKAMGVFSKNQLIFTDDE